MYPEGVLVDDEHDPNINWNTRLKDEFQWVVVVSIGIVTLMWPCIPRGSRMGEFVVCVVNLMYPKACDYWLLWSYGPPKLLVVSHDANTLLPPCKAPLHRTLYEQFGECL